MTSGERLIYNILKEQGYAVTTERLFPDCRAIHPLPFDICFTVGNQICLIEYDGPQHFRNEYGKKALKITQLHDNIKNNYCKNNNIPLLRICHIHERYTKTLVSSFIEKVSNGELGVFRSGNKGELFNIITKEVK